MIKRAAQTTCEACGWASKWTSSALADRALELHSCDRYRRRAAALAARLAREAATDRTPKPCRHERATHQHGTRNAYVLDKCRCLPCAAANAADEAHRIRQTAYGRWQPYVDAAPVREHIEQLMAAGMGAKRVAVVSGIAYSSVGALLYGRQRKDGLRPVTKLRPATAQALLAVRLDLADGALMAATGTRRRLQALVALGWSRAYLAGRLGMTSSNAGDLYRLARVSARSHRAVLALYEELSMQHPPCVTHRQKISVNRSRRSAAELGWAPPLAWDEEDIDDPAAKPAGQPRYIADLTEPVTWHHHRNMTDPEIGAALNRPAHTIRAVRDHLGLPGVHPHRRKAS